MDTVARQSDLEQELRSESQDNDDLISLISSQHSGVCYHENYFFVWWFHFQNHIIHTGNSVQLPENVNIGSDVGHYFSGSKST